MRENAHSPLFRDRISRIFKPTYSLFQNFLTQLAQLVFLACVNCLILPVHHFIFVSTIVQSMPFLLIYLIFHALCFRHVTSAIFYISRFGWNRFADCCRESQFNKFRVWLKRHPPRLERHPPRIETPPWILVRFWLRQFNVGKINSRLSLAVYFIVIKFMN